MDTLFIIDVVLIVLLIAQLCFQKHANIRHFYKTAFAFHIRNGFQRLSIKAFKMSYTKLYKSNLSCFIIVLLVNPIFFLFL